MTPDDVLARATRPRRLASRGDPGTDDRLEHLVAACHKMDRMGFDEDRRTQLAIIKWAGYKETQRAMLTRGDLRERLAASYGGRWEKHGRQWVLRKLALE